MKEYKINFLIEIAKDSNRLLTQSYLCENIEQAVKVGLKYSKEMEETFERKIRIITIEEVFI